MRTVKVPLAERAYSIHISQGLLGRLGLECRELELGDKCAVITDINVASRYGRECIKYLMGRGIAAALITVPPGETAKSLRTVQDCYDQLARLRLERKSFI